MTFVRYTLWLILCGTFCGACYVSAYFMREPFTLANTIASLGFMVVAADMLSAIRLTPWSASVKEAFDNPLPPR